MSGEASVDFQLGRCGVSWDRAQKMKHDLMAIVAAQHSMCAEAKANIVNEDGAETGRRLCYTCGIDGHDARFWVEDVPAVHVDWDMTEAEWEELRTLIWYSPGPYAFALREAGKLGTTPKPPPPALREPLKQGWLSATHVIFSRGGYGQWGCSCGHVWNGPPSTTACPLNPVK